MIAVPDYKSFRRELDEMRSHFFDRRSSGGLPKACCLENLVSSPTFSSSFSEGKEVPILSRAKMIGILFAQPSHSLAKEEITPNMDYFHYRSGRNINFYCAGYGDESSLGSYEDREPVGENASLRWMFSTSAFNTFRSELEQRSHWRYSGETELLLCNARLNRMATKVIPDLGVAVVCSLSKMKEDKAISSVMSLFEDIFRYAENQDPNDPTWGFSDAMAGQKSMPALKRLVLSLLPKGLGAEVERLAHLAIRDINK